MHWCVHPWPIHSLNQAKKQQNKSANTVKQQNKISRHKARHNLRPRVVKTVGVTGKISKWQLEKRAPKVLSSFLLQNASISQTQKHT